MSDRPSIGKRFLAAFIDYLLFYGLLFGYIVYFGEPNGEGGYHVTGIKSLVAPVWWFIYFPVIEGLSAQSLGKRIVKTRVIRADGGAIGFSEAFLRHLVDILDMFFFGLVALILMSTSENKQRLGDRLANTIVVEDVEAICIKCGDRLILSHRELQRGRFVCPVCKQENIVAQSVDKGYGSDVLDA